ncbi:tRNA pseudouridine(38-40) synthase TruA [Methanogenium sp. S4BF]|uniref:tRNA pseudouridine(38-40) synthase TruA n=1 Tax=Methanogenium sp. S4BF TaxID=1789226 RepID=UPI0024171799|nr:tRNA pseudouridine(38-40) synthase TruA [Methanogenium sp. S4BF]WFN34429.1 tRNA pseudouridine(38-40) synthase TruA [Methanogenium sp. S4BF]
MRLAFQVAYIGTNFYGSQMQPGLRTVEDTLISACRDLGLFDDWRTAGFAFSGRTDRGVHARGQICAFTTSLPDRARERLNYILPGDCWCSGWAETAETFHPRFDAESRTYRYYIHDDGSTDLSLMQKAAELLPGTHNFTHFSRLDGKNPEKTILSSEVRAEDGFYVYEIMAPGFLWNMVRCIVTALIAVGRNELDTDDLTALLTGAPNMRHLTPAPPEGLILWDIDCGIAFTPLESSDRMIYAFRERNRFFETMKKVNMLLD